MMDWTVFVSYIGDGFARCHELLSWWNEVISWVILVLDSRALVRRMENVFMSHIPGVCRPLWIIRVRD